MSAAPTCAVVSLEVDAFILRILEKYFPYRWNSVKFSRMKLIPSELSSTGSASSQTYFSSFRRLKWASRRRLIGPKHASITILARTNARQKYQRKSPFHSFSSAAWLNEYNLNLNRIFLSSLVFLLSVSLQPVHADPLHLLSILHLTIYSDSALFQRYWTNILYQFDGLIEISFMTNLSQTLAGHRSVSPEQTYSSTGSRNILSCVVAMETSNFSSSLIRTFWHSRRNLETLSTIPVF